MAKTVVGMFKYQEDVEAAIRELKQLGYDPKNISLIMKDVREAREVSDKTGTSVAEDATAGAATGGVIGGLTGLLVGIGAITIPGLGAFLISGPLAAALGLTGAAATTTTGAVTGAVAGGLIGALTGLGLPKEEARHYEEQIRGGGILLAVPTLDARSNEVRDILENHKASGVRQLDLFSDQEEYRHIAA